MDVLDEDQVPRYPGFYLLSCLFEGLPKFLWIVGIFQDDKGEVSGEGRTEPYWAWLSWLGNPPEPILYKDESLPVIKYANLLTISVIPRYSYVVIGVSQLFF